MNDSSANKKSLHLLQQIKSFLLREYDLFNSWKKRLLFISVLFISIVIILTLFLPFGLNTFNSNIRYLIIFKYVGYPLLTWFAILSTFSLLWHNSFTILKSIILFFYLAIISGCTSYFIWADHFNHPLFNWYTLMQFQKMALITGFIPILIIVTIHSNYILRKRLAESKALNDAICSNKDSVSEKTIIEIFSTEQNKKYKFQSNEIEYIQTQDNYIKVVTNSNPKNELIRVTLSNANDQIQSNCSQIFRCHNSYIINIAKVKRVEGNSAGYKLFLDDATIPVSRKYVPIVKSYLKQENR